MSERPFFLHDKQLLFQFFDDKQSSSRTPLIHININNIKKGMCYNKHNYFSALLPVSAITTVHPYSLKELCKVFPITNIHFQASAWIKTQLLYADEF